MTVPEVLSQAGATIRAYDPEGVEQARPLLRDVEFVADPYAAAEGAHALVIVTEWDEFRALDLKRVAELMAEPVLVDLRNIYPEEEVARAGLRYHGVGRASPD